MGQVISDHVCTFVLRATFDDGEGYPRSFFFYLNLQVKEGDRQVLSDINILAVLYMYYVEICQ